MREWKFDPKVQIETTIDYIKDYFAKNGSEDTKAVIGISGGKDSTIAAALLVRALGPERVLGVLMPDGKQIDIEDSHKICDALGIEKRIVDIGPLSVMFESAIGSVAYRKPQVRTNVAPRMRMAVLYAIAADVGGRVVNTGNRSEAWIGYTTKYGDFAGDFHLFQHITVRELLMMGRIMEEIPAYLVEKAPADGLTGSTDEESMGITYDQIDDYLLLDKKPDATTWHKMWARHRRNVHKTDAINLPGPRAKGREICEDDRWSF